LNSSDCGIFFNRGHHCTRLRLDDSTCAPLLAGAMTIMDLEISDARLARSPDTKAAIAKGEQ